MARTSVPVQGGVAVIESRKSGGATVQIHTGDASITLRLSRVAAARMSDALEGVVTEQLAELQAAVNNAIDTRTFRERIEQVAR